MTSSRSMSWGIASAVGYALVLSLVTFLISALYSFLAGRLEISVSPLYSLVHQAVEGLLMLVVLAGLVMFNSRTYGMKEMSGIRGTVMWTTLAFIFASALPYVVEGFISLTVQGFIAVIITSDVLSGVLGGLLKYISKM